MRPTPWTYLLGAVVLMFLGVMYVRSFVIGADPVPLVLVVIGLPAMARAAPRLPREPRVA